MTATDISLEQVHAIELQLDSAALLDLKREVFSKHYSEWYTHLAARWKYEDHVNILVRLMARLDECPNPTETGYCECAKCYEVCVYNWCIDTLDDICWSRAIYRANLKMPLGQAMKLKPRRKDCKPMEYEEHNGRLYIKIPTPPRHPEPFLIWVIEGEWKDWCEAIWPVHLKKDYRLGWYLAKSTKRELRSEGYAWFPCDVNVAHLFTACLHNEYVTAKDKNMLNFTDNNLIRSDCGEKNITDPDGIPRAFQLSLDVAGLDQWRPAKPTNTSHNDTADEAEDGSVSAKRTNLRKAHKQAEQAEQDGIAERTAKVEILKTAQARKAVQEGLDVLWKQGTAHLAPGLEKSA